MEDNPRNKNLKKQRMSRGNGNQWPQWDQGNRLPNNFSRSSSLRSSGHGNLIPQPDSRPADWQFNNNHVPYSSFRLPPDARSTTGMRQFEEIPVERRTTSNNSRFPPELHPSMQIALFNSMTQDIRPRMEPFPRQLPPRFPGIHRNALGIQSREDLAKQEQDKAMKMLKKVIYGSDPKNLTKRLSQYYNNVTGSSNATMKGNNIELDEDNKRCAICLDDFEPGTEVMVTPCNHMFHEDCILPWMKSHGQCPVCRFVISEQIKANAMALSSANAPPLLPMYGDLFAAEELPSRILPRRVNSSWDMFFSSF